MGVVRAHSSQNSCRSYFPCSINLCFSSRNMGRAALSWAPQVRWGLQSALANERWAEGRHYFEQSLKYCCTVCHPLFPCQRGQGRQRMMGRGASHWHPQGPRKTSVWRRNKHIVFILWKYSWERSVLVPGPKKDNAKKRSDYPTILLISHASKVMLKVLQAGLQQYVNRRLPHVQAGFRKGRETRDRIVNTCWIIEKPRELQKKFYFCFIDYTKALTVWIITNCGKFFKRWEYQITLSASWEICVQVKKQPLESDMEQWIFSKLGKEYVKVGYRQLAYLTYVQSTSCEMLDWLEHKLESRLLGQISITSDRQMIPPL